ncbi:hypothetical protein DFH08DRAFT_1084483 [Mycena albidolilacea]|uniref:F-box domain-containing protein n=1 Tax=Mycena albidolilacea TaxID=1033008 RepID=A0AAD6ZLH9_9AGAR|nr:hypothetical protein DFH08DRAFT_1084483 [Mycena albidolilacea]
MLLDLSVELLQEIGDQLARPDHMSLRQICRSVGAAIEPLFFSSLVLLKEELRIDMGRGFLEALATGQTGWSRYAQRLDIKSAKKWRGAGLQRSDTMMQELLASVLGSLSNIRTVKWESYKDPVWQVNALCDFLNNLPLLDDLRLGVYETTELSLGRLSGLKRLNIHASYMESPNHSLTSLHLSGGSGDARVWTMLHGNPHLQIHLTDISTGNVTPDLFAYLASYSGVEKLNFWGLSGRSRIQADDLADTFFTTVLPRHAKSLLELTCPAGYECRWSFGTHNVDALSALHNVRSLYVSMNPDEPVDAAHLLLRTVDLLPHLQRLTIDSADPDSLRNVQRGCLISSEDTVIDRVVKTVMQDFRSRVASPMILRCGFMGCDVYVRKYVESEKSAAAAEGGAMWAYQFLEQRGVLDE